MIATICAAPLILDAVGILKGKEYVCFPSCETNIDGIYKENERVVVSDHIITSKAAGTTFDFAFAIIKYLANEEVANMVCTMSIINKIKMILTIKLISF